ncbi:cell division protein ZapA [Enterovirga sp.]|uniref:cell division protein ZapA n=1 Tax=Enterovirga sp. TaxID=2026350 RepID=UPI00262B662F|nr:cell division protein ZapA [Enterovirga sp.]
MAHVQVTIAGRSYRMACGEGEERHLEALAAAFDSRIAEMRRTFGEIGDMRLHVMAALMTADELAETRRRVEALEGEVAAMRAVAAANVDRSEKAERQLADALNLSAERLDRLSRSLGPGADAAG